MNKYRSGKDSGIQSTSKSVRFDWALNLSGFTVWRSGILSWQDSSKGKGASHGMCFSPCFDGSQYISLLALRNYGKLSTLQSQNSQNLKSLHSYFGRYLTNIQRALRDVFPRDGLYLVAIVDYITPAHFSASHGKCTDLVLRYRPLGLIIYTYPCFIQNPKEMIFSSASVFLS